MRSPYTLTLFVFSLCLGIWLNERAWNGQVFVYIGEQRSPAAVRSISEYSSLDRQALHRSAQEQLLAHAQVLRDGDRLGVQLGHPLVDRDGGKEFGCQVQDHFGAFDQVELTFMGNGIAENGVAPHMVVTSRCRSQQDLNQLDTIWIPLGEILGTPAQDREFLFPSSDPVSVRLEHMPDQWPENWVLWSVRFFRQDDTANSLTLDSSLLRQARPDMLTLELSGQ